MPSWLVLGSVNGGDGECGLPGLRRGLCPNAGDVGVGAVVMFTDASMHKCVPDFYPPPAQAPPAAHTATL